MKILRVTIVLCGLGIAAGAAVSGQQASRPTQNSASSSVLRAGCARVDITPETPLALDGYLDPENRISTGIHDRLFARAIAFGMSGKRLVLISADVTSFTSAGIFRKAILEEHKLRPDELFLCATHTHSGPFLSQNRSYPHPGNFTYTRELARKLTAVTGAALGRMIPVRLGIASEASTVGVNRRNPLPDGRVEMAPNPDGPRDPEVLVLKLFTESGRSLAALFSYACHSRSLNGENTLISGDIFGIAAQHVERKSGEGFITAGFGGASGDIDPARVVSGFTEASNGVPVTESLGLKLGDAVLAGLQKVRFPNPANVIRTAERRVVLPRKWQGQTGAVTVTAARIGEIAIVGLDCEALVEVGLEIKKASPFQTTFLITNCNGWSGYLPPAHRYPEGGYEITRSGYSPEAAGILVREVTRLLHELKKN